MGGVTQFFNLNFNFFICLDVFVHWLDVMFEELCEGASAPGELQNVVDTPGEL